MATDDMEPCEAEGCQRPRHPRHLLCLYHFHALPMPQKMRLARAVKMYSPQHREFNAAADEAIRCLARMEGREGDNRFSRKVRDIDSGRRTIIKKPKENPCDSPTPPASPVLP